MTSTASVLQFKFKKLIVKLTTRSNCLHITLYKFLKIWLRILTDFGVLSHDMELVKQEIYML